MLYRIIRIAAVLGALSLAGGCARTYDLTPEETASSEAISFSASSLLLRDDAGTKSTTEGFISNDDTFSIFGERVTSANQHSLVFNGVTVEHLYNPPTDIWQYNPLGFWLWSSQADRYDFVAVSPAGIGSENEHAVGNLSVSTHYDLTEDDYDILAATYRRSGSEWGERFNSVDLSFSHMGSAVGITIQNNSQNKPVTLNYIQFRNLVVSADAKASLDNYGRTNIRWANQMPDAAAVRQLTPGQSISASGSYSGEYQIMIPQNLVTYGAVMDVNYTVGGFTYTETFTLALIERSDGTPITAWEIGHKYTYNISMRMDGGLLVTVSTTPWDVPVEAETPGILI